MTTTKIRFYTGKDYPDLCNKCRTTIDKCVDLVHMGADTDDKEAPAMYAYDNKLFCGGHDCECDCSIGNPSFDNEFDLLCRVHGGTKEEQQSFYDKLCKTEGHYFPQWTATEQRDGVCLQCFNAYGRRGELSKIS
mgnify:CR=1 FL=1